MRTCAIRENIALRAFWETGILMTCLCIFSSGFRAVVDTTPHVVIQY